MANQATGPSSANPIARRLQPVWPWLALGVAAVIAGGLLAAVVAHDPTEKPVWASAYLVLVVGVGQFGLALGRALLATRPVTASRVALEFVVFALGNTAVILGTLIDAVWLVDVGGVLLLVALVMMVWGLRSPAEAPEFDRSRGTTWLLWSYRLLVAVLVVSIPVGLLLARG